MRKIDGLSLLENLYYRGFIERVTYLNYYYMRKDDGYIEEILLKFGLIDKNYKETLAKNGIIVSNRIKMTNMDIKDYGIYKKEGFLIIDLIENNLYIGLSRKSSKDKIQSYFSHKNYNTINFIYLEEAFIHESLEAFFKTKPNKLEIDRDRQDSTELLNKTIEKAIDLKASDIHIEPFEDFFNIRFRVNGSLSIYKTLEIDRLAGLVTRLKVLSKLDIAEKRDIQDGEFSIEVDNEDHSIRVAIVPTIYGEKVALRLFSSKKDHIDIDQLELGCHLGNFRNLIDRKSGLVIITGPTGSGKTTTLYSILEYLRDTDKNIMTIEDPVEYRIEGINQIQVNEKINFDFEKGLKAVLRNDPDVIMLGEIRNKETAINASRASLTGHLVLSTIHTNDSFEVIDRLLDIGVEAYVVGSSLKGVINQRLVRILCPTCKEAYLSSSYENLILSLDNSIDLYRHNPKGCGNCYKGYRGRKAVYEILMIDDIISEKIREEESLDPIKREVLKKYHGIREELVRLICSGSVGFDELYNIGIDSHE